MVGDKIKRWFAKSRPRSSDEVDKAVWDHSFNWEAWETEVDYWWDQPEAEELMAVGKLFDTEPAAAFQKYRELADNGCVQAMICVGYCYRYGLGTEANFDQAYAGYSLAVEAGSWIATRDMAEFLYNNGNYAECEEHLNEGMRCDFISAYFWLAWYRILRSYTPETCREARPLLEHAAAEGHPHAEKYLAALMIKGKFGIREIPSGLKMLRNSLKRFSEYEEGKVA
jgi:TPR repeat protein